MMTIRYQWMSMTVCMRALSSVSRILFSVRMMSGCSRLVGHSCLGRPSDVVVASIVKLSMIRRDVRCRSTLQAWCCKCHWRFLGDAPQCTPYSSYIFFRPQPKSVELGGAVISSNYYTLVTNDFHQFKTPHNLCSFPLIGRFGWRHRLIWCLIARPYMQILIHLSMCIRCRSLIAWITNYYIIFT